MADAFDQQNDTGAPVHVPALGRMVQPGEIVTFNAAIAGLTPIPSPSADVPAATAQLAQDVADAPQAAGPANAPSAPSTTPVEPTDPAKSQAAAATPKKED